MTGPKISAILLAAGLSRRMARDKLALLYTDKTMLQHAVLLLEALPVSEKIIVTTASRLESLALPPEILAVINPHPEKGQSESLKLGVSAATKDLYLFLSADQPMLDSNCLTALLEAAVSNYGKIVYPLVFGKPCMPALFPACFREELLGLCGDTGGRAIRKAHPEACLAVDIKNPEKFADIDSDEDYDKLT